MMQNQTVNGYTLHHQLGAGGMAEVWVAENRIGKKAAVKIIKKELSLLPEIVTRFENEARVMVTLNHPHIRQVYDYAMIDGRPCIIMEYLEGADLSARLKSGERFSQSDMETWWNQLVEALNYTHAQNIVHRDIKPSNLFLTTDGQIKLLDFGIAKVKGGLTHTQTGTRMGTLLYMSPEQVKDSKHLDHRTDVYSLAVTFFHLVTGMAPYDNTKSSEFEIQVKIVQESLDMSNLNVLWKNVLEPYLSKDFELRPKLKVFGESKPVVSGIHTEQTRLEHHAPSEPTFIESQDLPRRAERQDHKNQLQTFTEAVNGVSFKMVAIKGGTFQMGSEDGDADEKPVHSVTVSDFYMGETVVTQALWQAVMGSNPSNSKGDNLPVEQVSWDDAQEFIKKLNRLTGKSYKLPTEAEWEYAAGGGATNRTTWAGTNSESSLGSYAWYDGNSNRQTHPVGTQSPNGLGLYDMSGNVWEWCEDDWHNNYLGAQDDNLAWIDSHRGSNRVNRGSSSRGNPKHCRVTHRNGLRANHRSEGLGFRVALAP